MNCPKCGAEGFYGVCDECGFPVVSIRIEPKQTGIVPGRYRHFKGNEYRVLHMAKHSETQEDMVVYQALYGDQGIWVRPASMWDEEVERDGVRYKRFTYIGE